jgi:pyruvate,water dikinase
VAQAVAAATDVRPFSELSRAEVGFAGGKGANLGELVRAGLPVPPGFVVGAPAYAAFCDALELRQRIGERLSDVDVDDAGALQAAAAELRALIESAPVPEEVERLIRAAYRELAGGDHSLAVAVRSSATAEDTEAASFAGMNETFLNVIGGDEVVAAVRRCWSSLFGARTVFYRAKRGFGQADMDIAVVVQRQIASTRAGVMFTLDPATGATDRLVIEGTLGLGESVVAGSVSPDRYVVSKATRSVVAREVHGKNMAIEVAAGGGTLTRELSGEEAQQPVLTDREAKDLAALGCRIEEHYGAAQDTEWAFDADGRIWILQSRPITAIGAIGEAHAEPSAEEHVLLRGLGAGPGRASGPARVLATLADAERLGSGDVLVTHMTAPDWVPLMRRAAGIVTDSGGMTCHAAIVSRELGIPCVVGTQEATSKLRDGELVSVDAGRGLVIEGAAVVRPSAQAPMPAAPTSAGSVITGTQILLNLSEPSHVDQAAILDADGVGLLRAELMIVEALEGMHPRLLLEQGRQAEFVTRMADGLAAFARGFDPRPITYRTYDFRTNEFRGLTGGERFEPVEANPMIGYRGAHRYAEEPELFTLELEAIRRVWDTGATNVHVMLPFVRTPAEVDACKSMVASSGLLDRPGFELWVMAEVPSVLFHLERYARLGIAGISIGSNDLTQLLLGADRDSELLAAVFDERDDAVVAYLRELIAKARSLGLKTSICGQAPSVWPEYAELLVRAGIDAVSVSADVYERTRRLVAAAERRMLLDAARPRVQATAAQ